MCLKDRQSVEYSVHELEEELFLALELGKLLEKLRTSRVKALETTTMIFLFLSCLGA
jgi:hypothetical protein